MLSKLSQAPHMNRSLAARVPPEAQKATDGLAHVRHRGHPNRRARFDVLAIVISGLGIAACSDNQAGADDPRALDRDAASTTTVEARIDETFRWPESGGHPAIAIEVELLGRAGTIEVELMPELAPTSVERVLTLSREGYYDGTTFHRVIPGFMIQGGDPNSRDRDPTNDGRGGDPTPIPDEFGATPFDRGVVALANRGQPGSTSPQLFIMHAENRGLNGRYNVVGRVVAGLELVDAITEVETDAVGRWGPKDRPTQNVLIRKVTAMTRPSGAGSSDAAGRTAPAS
ncbi:MAG: peptidylprolyl isomerase [Deltaproteobacteria bacterium]|nr:peptidylprolyl isomerase [Deltaproteobacteria bacterium]